MFSTRILLALVIIFSVCSFADNLVPNPGFEENSGGWPNNWYEPSPMWASRPPKLLDSTESNIHSGNYSWKCQNNGNVYSGAYSDYIEVDPNNYYRLSVWIKSANGSEKISLGWEEFNVNNTSLGVNYFVLSNRTSPTEWTLFSSVDKPSYNDTAYIRIRFFGPYLTSGTVWWDDFNLEKLGNGYLAQYGHENSESVKSIDFGANTDVYPNYQGGFDWHESLSAMGSRVNGEPNYRELKAGRYITLTIPEFNLDANDLPMSPMLLEIAYKDTIDDKIGVNGGTADEGNLAFVKSRIDYFYHDPILLKASNLDPNDPDNYYTSTKYYSLFSIGGRADNRWKYLQYTIPKTSFPLVRSINGKFMFRIYNNYGDSNLPIDYISLRVIDPNVCNALEKIQRTVWKFTEAELSDIGESDPNVYDDPNLIVFTRDMMKPVYNQTRPENAEITDSIFGFSFTGETEPMSFALYSKDGLSDFTIEWEEPNLVNSEDSSYVISAPTIYHVVCDNKRLSAYNNSNIYRYSYAVIADRIEEFSEGTILPDNSQRYWIKVRVPSSVIGGKYEGEIRIKKNGNTLKTISVCLVVYEMELEPSKHINPVYNDPFIKVYGTDLNAVLDLYTETGFAPFYRSESIQLILNDANEIVGYDTSLFEERLNRMIEKGFVKDCVTVVLNSTWAKSYQYIFEMNASVTPKADLWNNLSNSSFVNAIELLIEKLNNIAADDPNDPNDLNLTFIYSVIDEPGSYPYQRIVADRLYSIIKYPNVNSLTTVTYQTACENVISGGSYYTPYQGNSIPALTNLVDYKVWAPGYQGVGFSKGYKHYGYYTTSTSYLRNPIYNRFLHGLLAYATDAEVVSAYAMGDYVGNPYNDFDPAYTQVYPLTYPDFVFAYPTWTGKLIPTMALEGIREGIKDAKYIATLRKLIEDNLNDPIAIDANEFLFDIKSRINTDYWNVYLAKSTKIGYYPEILRKVSDANAPDDYEAFTRIRETIVDYILALAYGVHNVTADSWYTVIQDAINDAEDGDEIVVYPGTYYETITINDWSGTLRSLDPNDPDIVAATVIDANGVAAPVVTFSNGASGLLEGFTITGANNDTGAGWGGGIYCHDTGTNPTIKKCTIEWNYAGDGGGMMTWNGAYPVLIGCTIYKNSAEYGGGIESSGGGHLIGCVITDNQCTYNGGGLYLNGSSIEVENCVIMSNQANTGGGIFTNNDTDPNTGCIITNCTITSNSATNIYAAGGIYNYYSSPQIKNCIIYSNTINEQSSQIKNSASAVPEISYCCIEDCGDSGPYWDTDLGADGGGNIGDDPSFADPNDYHIASNSPCIDVGNNSAVSSGDKDIDGDDRIIDGGGDPNAIVDMGADEHNPD